MIRVVLLAFLWALGFTSIGFSHDLVGGDVLISPYDNSIETEGYLITFEYSDGSSIKVAPWIDREAFLMDAEFGVYILKNKKTGYEARSEIILDGGFEPYFYGYDEAEYCGVDVLFVTVWRDTPRYGGSLTRWITTDIFRADTFEMIEEFSGSALDVTRFDNRVKPEVPSSMDERYLVSCIPEGRGRKFSFGLIDRKALYGPDWCGPGGERCKIR